MYSHVGSCGPTWFDICIDVMSSCGEADAATCCRALRAASLLFNKIGDALGTSKPKILQMIPNEFKRRNDMGLPLRCETETTDVQLHLAQRTSFGS